LSGDRSNNRSQSRRNRSPPPGGIGWSEATTILPEPCENAKSGSGQVIRAHSDNAAAPSAALAQSNVRLIKRSNIASIAIAIFLDERLRKTNLYYIRAVRSAMMRLRHS